MKMYAVPPGSAAFNSVIHVLFLAGIIFILLQPSSLLWAQYEVKNDRILAPEVSHFTRIATPGVDSHGDLNLAIPFLKVPGREGLDFDIVAQYRAGIQVTQSASWIGLGWELDLGSVTRQALGGVRGYKQADFAHALNDDGANKINAQPDVYAVNMNGNSTLLLSMTKEVNPNIPFNPANSESTGPCSGNNLYSQWFFVTSPWEPWKFCYTTSGPSLNSPVKVDGKKTAVGGDTLRDFSKFVITTENGTRYVYSGANDLPTLSHAYFPELSSPYNEINYTFVSTWRLRAILAPNYTGPDVPNSTSTGGWIKIVYKTWDHQTGAFENVDTISDGSGRIIAQITYPYYVETPTHFAFFTTSKRYDRNLIANLDCSSTCYWNGIEQNYYSRKLDKITLYKKDPEDVGVPRSETGPGTYDVKISEVSFTYLDNGARGPLESYSSSNPKFKQMLSKLALQEITISGVSGTSNLALPSHKFTYYDTFNKSWIDLLQTQNNNNLTIFQDEFGFLEENSVSKGEMWSLQQITYPEGGRHFVTYANDSLATLSLSYKKYNGTATSYSQVNANFARAQQGGARAQSIATYNGYNDSTPATPKLKKRFTLGRLRETMLIPLRLFLPPLCQD